MKIARHQWQHSGSQRHCNHEQLPHPKRQRQSANNSAACWLSQSRGKPRRKPLRQSTQIDSEVDFARLVSGVPRYLSPTSHRAHIGLRRLLQPRQRQTRDAADGHEGQLKVESRRASGLAASRIRAAIAAEFSSSNRRNKNPPSTTIAAIIAARNTGARCSTTATYAESIVARTASSTLVTAAASRPIQLGANARAPPCKPATTST